MLDVSQQELCSGCTIPGHCLPIVLVIFHFGFVPIVSVSCHCPHFTFILIEFPFALDALEVSYYLIVEPVDLFIR